MSAMTHKLDPGGPLSEMRILEFSGVGPCPFAAMMLADAGAEVLRVDRDSDQNAGTALAYRAMHRGRPTLHIDLKAPGAKDQIVELCAAAHGLVEGYRPGVMERLGLGPDELQRVNHSLVYGRVSGYGQAGPMAHLAGHDINYLAMTGILSQLSRENEIPQFPLNLLSNFGAGGAMLAFGMAAGLLEAQTTGRGRVVDVAMTDGVALMMTMLHSMRAAGLWSGAPGTNFIDGGAHFYNVYRTADNRFVAIGAIEAPFYANLLAVLKLDAVQAPQWDRALWSELKVMLAGRFAELDLAHWVTAFEGIDACFTPVLTVDEAVEHKYAVDRMMFNRIDGLVHPTAVPRFSEQKADLTRSFDVAAVTRRWADAAAQRRTCAMTNGRSFV